MPLIRPGYLVSLVEILATSQLLYAGWPYRRRRYFHILLLCTVGVVLGQVWSLLGLPAAQLGDANVLPAIVFAVAVQPLADRLPPKRCLATPRRDEDEESDNGE